MPDHLRALVVILVLATVVFTTAKAPACAIASTTADFERRRNLWFGVTLAAFLAHNFWIYIIAAAALLFFALRREPNKLAMYFFLLFALPRMADEVPGLGLVNYLFEMDYLRLLTMTVLFPVFLSLRRQPGIERFGRSMPDKLIAGYIIYNFLLLLTYAPFTSALRHGAFDNFIDIFLPYYVASRYLKDLRGFRDALMSFVVAAMVLSAIGAFESMWQWLLYSGLDRALEVRWGGGIPLMRGGNLRAAATTGQAIVLGYLIAVAIGLFLYLKKSVPNTTRWGLGMVLLTAGLIASISRGPWVGAGAMVLLFVATGPAPGLGLAKLGLLGVLALPVLLAIPGGEKFIDYLPWVGTAEQATVDGRAQLAEIAFQVFLQNPVFGTYDYLANPVMEALRGGDGMIDIVNTYAAVGLGSGLIGLSFFTGFFVAVVLCIYKGMKSLADRNDEHYVLGQALFSTLLGILFIIFTVSSIHFIPVVYWSVGGLGVAYAHMMARRQEPIPQESAKPESASANSVGVRIAVSR